MFAPSFQHLSIFPPVITSSSTSSSYSSSSSLALQSAGSQADSANWFVKTHLNSHGNLGTLGGKIETTPSKKIQYFFPCGGSSCAAGTPPCFVPFYTWHWCTWRIVSWFCHEFSLINYLFVLELARLLIFCLVLAIHIWTLHACC